MTRSNLHLAPNHPLVSCPQEIFDVLWYDAPRHGPQYAAETLARKMYGRAAAGEKKMIEIVTLADHLRQPLVIVSFNEEWGCWVSERISEIVTRLVNFVIAHDPGSLGMIAIKLYEVELITIGEKGRLVLRSCRANAA